MKIYEQQIQRFKKFTSINIGTFQFDSQSYEAVMKNKQQQIQFKKHLKESEFGNFGMYVGEFNTKRMVREGVGIEIEEDKIYIGYFLNNKRHGKGSIISNSYFFEGYFQSDEAQGQGTYYSEETKYLGNFNGSILEGSQIKEENEKRQEKYIGQYVEGRRQGKGVYSWKGEKIVYTGEFRMNMIAGQGQAVWKSEEGSASYKGGFINNRMHFEGYYKVLDKKEQPVISYEGHYYNGQRHGHGQYKDYLRGQNIQAYFQNGKIYHNQYVIYNL